MNVSARAQAIRAVILDVDGVLTDGRIGYGGGPDAIKFFNAKDGHGIKLMRRAGLMVGILSGRKDEATARRANELSLDFVYEGEKNKPEALERLLREYSLTADECLYVGDDVVDIPVMKRCGLGIAVADAAPEALEAADRTTALPGGHGAVREVAKWLLDEQGKWAGLMRRYVE